MAILRPRTLLIALERKGEHDHTVQEHFATIDPGPTVARVRR